MLGDIRFHLAQSGLFQRARDVPLRFRQRDSYGQHGEDRFILDTVFAGRTHGTYLDIGASHPVRISNTWLFYRHGWSGVVVEPIRRLLDQHRRWRPRDRQLQALIGDADGTLDFFSLYPSVLSTCSVAHYESLLADGNRLVEQVTLPQLTVRTLLDRFDLAGKVDFLSVDIEGLDTLVAAQLHDFADDRLPRCVCIEFSDATAAARIADLLGPRYAHRRDFGPNLIFW